MTVDALPEMITFTPDGTKLLVANEGKPSEDYTIDPEGSISIIDVSGVQTTPDTLLEGYETFTVSLSNPTSGAIISSTNGTAKGTINNTVS